MNKTSMLIITELHINLYKNKIIKKKSLHAAQTINKINNLNISYRKIIGLKKKNILYANPARNKKETNAKEV